MKCSLPSAQVTSSMTNCAHALNVFVKDTPENPFLQYYPAFTKVYVGVVTPHFVHSGTFLN